MRVILKSLIAGIILFGGVASTSPVADVTVEEKVAFDGFGGNGWGASESRNLMRLSDDRLQQESTSRMTGKFMRHLSKEGGDRTGSIMRLDRRVLYSLDYAGKTYTEISFDRLRQAGDEAMAHLSGPPPQPETDEPPPEITCDPVELSARETGEKEKINGFPARQFEVKGKQTCRNEETKEACTLSYDLSVWNTPVAGGLTEVRSFMTRQAEAMGYDMAQLRAKSGAAGALLMGDASGMEAAFKEIGKLEGYPVRTRFEIFSEGGCGRASVSGESESSESMGETQMKGIKKLFSKFKRKKKDKEPQKVEASATEPAAPGRSKLFGMKSEILSISSDPVPAEFFEPPADFTKQEWEIEP
jgi:hypothetical protein